MYNVQQLVSWPFWLWIMAVTWLYLPLTLSRLGLRNLGMWAWAVHLKYIRFSQKVGRGPWLKRKLCLGPTSVINCTLLSTLSFWVSLFPGAFGYNIWCNGQETPHFGRQVPFGATPRPHGSDLLDGRRRLALLERFLSLMPGSFMLVGSGWQQGSWVLR